ncbi:acylphosphatase [Pseudomonadota bacterium]
MAICRSFLISGRVQGVWYRASTQSKAQDLNVTGYAKNLPDGRVEVLACGTKENIEELQGWLWEGPPSADVNSVEGVDVEAYPLTTFVSM